MSRCLISPPNHWRVFHRAALAAFIGAAGLATMPASGQPQAENIPLYPNTHALGTAKTPTNEQAVARAIEQGVTLNIYTDDSPETVDAWYSQKLPKTCKRSQIEGTRIYRHVCIKRTVNISPAQGQTSINIGPNVEQ